MTVSRLVTDAVIAEGLVKHYKEVKALDGLDLRVPQGSVLGVLGPNGAGKTTAVRILTTLLKPDAGRAQVAGIDVVEDPAGVRTKIGVSGQYAAVDEYLTGFENLDMIGRLYHLGRKRSQQRAREWPSLRRLLELGVTISGTGRRETGLERGEYDQGQHDRTRDVLAVNTAGMLVRRDVFDQLGGFDPRLPVFGNDIDFGWRAARAGHRTLVVPDAVVFHVEAAHRGVRRTPLTGSHRRSERRAALYTLLVNGSLVALPFHLVRLFLGSLVRAAGLLLVRAPREAYDEVVALLATYLRPDRVVTGRLERRRTATVPPRAVRHLLAPPWLPYRHGLDFVTDVASAVGHQAGELSSARRSRRGDTLETGEENDHLAAETPEGDKDQGG